MKEVIIHLASLEHDIQCAAQGKVILHQADAIVGYDADARFLRVN